MDSINSKNPLPVGKSPERIVLSKRSKDLIEYDRNTEAVIKKDDYLVLSPNFIEVFFDFLYKNLYILGIQFIRKYRVLTKRSRLFLQMAKATFLAMVENGKLAVGRGTRSFFRGLKAPFINIQEAFAEGVKSYRKARTENQSPFSTVLITGKTLAKEIWSIINTALNYAAPVLAFLILLNTITANSQVTKGLMVTYRGEDIGFIQNEINFSNAVKDVRSRLMEDLNAEFAIDIPVFNIVEMNNDSIFLNEKQLADTLIRASSDDITAAFGLYANGHLVGAVEDSGPVLTEIELIRKANSTEQPDERVQFVKDISFKEGLFPSSSVILSNELISIITAVERPEIKYTVKEDDTPVSIAIANGVPLATLEKLNAAIFAPINPDEEGIVSDKPVELVPGQEIYIAKAEMFLSAKNIFTITYPVDIPFQIVKNQNYTYAASYYNVEKAGVPGELLIEAEITEVDGEEVDRNIIAQTITRLPSSELVTVGVDRSSIPDTIIEQGDIDESGFAWPGKGGYVGGSLGSYSGHTGADIIGTGGFGMPIFASASGTVTKATLSSWGYGNNLKIQHSGGYETLYAHCSELYVSVGDYVNKGQIIATVGSTGNSTGPHIHFEIILNGQIMNPTNYVGTTGPIRQ